MKGSLHNPGARSMLRWLPAFVLTVALLMSVFFSPVILQTAKAAPPVIKIGVAAALSGGADWLGWRQANSVQLAIDQINSAGGIDVGGIDYNLELVSENSSCDAAQAITAANNLVAVGVVAVVGHSCSLATIPAEPVYDAAGIAMISGSATSPLVTTQGYDIAFRTISKDTTLTDDLASRIYEKLGLTMSGVPVGWIPARSDAASLTDYAAAAGAAAEGDYAAMSYRRTADMPGYEGFDSNGDVIPQWNWLMHYQGGPGIS